MQFFPRWSTFEGSKKDRSAKAGCQCVHDGKKRPGESMDCCDFADLARRTALPLYKMRSTNVQKSASQREVRNVFAKTLLEGSTLCRMDRGARKSVGADSSHR